jgi:MoxR-like ATPase
MTEIVPDLANLTRSAPSEPIVIPPSRRVGKDAPKSYIPDRGLVDAMRAALLLRRPLLLTGEPGTGKTHAAHYLNWKLGYGEVALRFDAKSTSTAKDLFYTYNTIGRFQAAQTKEGSQNSVDYIRYTALGEAILRAMPSDAIKKWVPFDFEHPGAPSQSVVLIDEIDKAPRDFPNDVLNEIEYMRFRVLEFNNVEFSAQPAFFPVVVLTSNSEKNLPAAFLRRCVYYNIPKPDEQRFREIVTIRLGVDSDSPLLQDALSFLMFLRGAEADLSKRPATAELIDWIVLLEARGAEPQQRFDSIREIVESTLVTVVKDQGRDPADLLNSWLARKG